jgi:hypothetical protein
MRWGGQGGPGGLGEVESLMRVREKALMHPNFRQHLDHPDPGYKLRNFKLKRRGGNDAQDDFQDAAVTRAHQ